MKKLFTLSLAALLSVSLLAGCGGNNEEGETPEPTDSPVVEDVIDGDTDNAADNEGGLKDGEYKAEAPEFDDKGYKATAVVTVKDGKVADVKFDAVTEDGQSKRELSESGEYAMKAKGGSLAEWHEEIETFEKAIVEKGGVSDFEFNEEGKTDAVAGVTIIVDEYAQLFEKALEEAK